MIFIFIWSKNVENHRPLYSGLSALKCPHLHRGGRMAGWGRFDCDDTASSISVLRGWSISFDWYIAYGQNHPSSLEVENHWRYSETQEQVVLNRLPRLWMVLKACVSIGKLGLCGARFAWYSESLSCGLLWCVVPLVGCIRFDKKVARMLSCSFCWS